MTGPRLIDATELPGFGLSVGLIFIQGAGYRVGASDPDGVRHMAPAAARRLARELSVGEHAEELKPAIEALNNAADKLDALEFPMGSA